MSAELEQGLNLYAIVPSGTRTAAALVVAPAGQELKLAELAGRIACQGLAHGAPSLSAEVFAVGPLRHVGTGHASQVLAGHPREAELRAKIAELEAFSEVTGHAAAPAELPEPEL